MMQGGFHFLEDTMGRRKYECDCGIGYLHLEDMYACAARNHRSESSFDVEQSVSDRIEALELAVKVLARMQRAYCSTLISIVEGKDLTEALQAWDKLYADTVQQLTGGHPNELPSENLQGLPLLVRDGSRKSRRANVGSMPKRSKPQ